ATGRVNPFFFSDRHALWGEVLVDRRTEAKGWKRAMIHLCTKPSTTEVDHDPRLFYHLSAHRPGRLPRPGPLANQVPPLARPCLSGSPRVVPRGLRPGLRPQGPKALRQARPAPAPHPLQGHPASLHRPPLLRPALPDRLHRRGRETLVPASL